LGTAVSGFKTLLLLEMMLGSEYRSIELNSASFAVDGDAMVE